MDENKNDDDQNESGGESGKNKLGGTTNFSYDPDYYDSKEIDELTQKHMDKLENLIGGLLSDLPNGSFIETNIFFTIDYYNEEEFISNKKKNDDESGGMHLI